MITECPYDTLYIFHPSVPEDKIKNYISAYGLRTHGEINGTPVSQHQSL